MDYSHLNYKGFFKVHPNLSPMRVLNENERKSKINTNQNMHTVFTDNLIVKELNAVVGDVICIRNLHNDVYRLVINRS
jgi:hypothetical protein